MKKILLRLASVLGALRSLEKVVDARVRACVRAPMKAPAAQMPRKEFSAARPNLSRLIADMFWASRPAKRRIWGFNTYSGVKLAFLFYVLSICSNIINSSFERERLRTVCDASTWSGIGSLAVWNSVRARATETAAAHKETDAKRLTLTQALSVWKTSSAQNTLPRS